MIYLKMLPTALPSEMLQPTSAFNNRGLQHLLMLVWFISLQIIYQEDVNICRVQKKMFVENCLYKVHFQICIKKRGESLEVGFYVCKDEILCIY
jgi:hypothetical protein